MTVTDLSSGTDIAVIAAMINGDRWLSADACAAYLGQISRRTFLETIAVLPDFPKPMTIGKIYAWKKSEIEAWAETHRKNSLPVPRRRRKSQGSARPTS